METKVPGYFDKIRDDVARIDCAVTAFGLKFPSRFCSQALFVRRKVVPRDRGADYEDGTWGTVPCMQSDAPHTLAVGDSTSSFGCCPLAQDTMTFQDDELSYALGKQAHS